MPDAHAGRAARDHLDRVLASRPIRDGDALTATAKDLATFRDRVVARYRAEGGPRRREALDHVNAVISIVLAGQFPIGQVPWGELEKARDWLDAVLRDEAAQ